MRQKLIIVGARAFGRETCNYARDAGFDVVGFLDDKLDATDGFVGYPPVLCSVEKYEVKPGDRFICAVGDSQWREKYVRVIAAKGGAFVNVIHPSAFVGPNVKMGVGCVICPRSVVDCDLTIGNHVDVNALAYVSHDSMIEDFVTISPGCHLGGRAILHRGAFLGIHSSLVPDVEIGSYTRVAAGAVVTKSLPCGVMAAGVPAVVKKRLERQCVSDFQ